MRGGPGAGAGAVVGGGAAPDDHLLADAAPHLAAVEGEEAQDLRRRDASV